VFDRNISIVVKIFTSKRTYHVKTRGLRSKHACDHTLLDINKATRVGRVAFTIVWIEW